MSAGLSASAIAGIASAGVGLLSGSGRSGSQTQQAVMDPRMVPYIFGADKDKPGGLMDMAQKQLMQSRSPEQMQGWNTMMNRGAGLLGGSVAGNPFSGGYQGGTNFGPASGMGNGLSQYTPQPIPQAPAQTAPTANSATDDFIAELMRQDQIRRDIEAGYLNAYDRG